ncbi:MAG: hypothetical protein JSV86_00940 [Gemmatimonadota bacterium]|nr:MAG: hypothetical protein JSV86_00940 [Gemmatimonadota bacterium]
MKPTVLLIGLGDLGGVILELLAREEGVGRIVTADLNEEGGTARCRVTRLGALAHGRRPDIRFTRLDLANREAVAEIVRREAPDLILSTATLATWWLPNLLPDEQAARIKRAGFGVWLPVHLTPTLWLMEALRDAGYPGHVVTAPFPDVVNPILGKVGLPPTCGIGNLSEMVPKIRLLAAERLESPPEALRVYMVAHHALERWVFAGPFGTASDEMPPYFLRVEHAGADVTAAVDANDLLLAPYPLPAGRVTHFLTAGTTIPLIRALLADEETFLHAPAPNGLPGGYPVLAGRGGVRPAPIEGLRLEEAIEINERSHRFDGIERIEEDGTAVFVSEPACILRDELGYDCERLAPGEAEVRAGELVARFKEYAKKHGTDI